MAGQGYLISKLRDAGLSHRRAVRILNAVLDAMKEALQRGEEVEFAWGKLRRRRLWRREHWVVIDHRPTRRQPYTVELQLDKAGERLLYAKSRQPVRSGVRAAGTGEPVNESNPALPAQSPAAGS